MATLNKADNDDDLSCNNINQHHVNWVPLVDRCWFSVSWVIGKDTVHFDSGTGSFRRTRQDVDVSFRLIESRHSGKLYAS